MGWHSHRPHPPAEGADVVSTHEASYGIIVWANPTKSHAIDIVFVHGLTGGRESTWAVEDGTPWPKVLLAADLPNARIMSFGYDADVIKFWTEASQNRIADHSRSLLTRLANVRDETDTADVPIVFVGHSLGGLVCEDVLLASRNSAEAYKQRVIAATAGIIFMGTPHHGSHLADWAALAVRFLKVFRSPNDKILHVLGEDSEVLGRVQNDFQTMIRARNEQGEHEIRLFCFYEELPVSDVGLIVPSESAILSAYDSLSIHANHMNMTKFTSRNDSYNAVKGVLSRWLREIQKMESLPPPVARSPTSGEDRNGKDERTREQFFDAVRNNNVELVRKLARGFDVDQMIFQEERLNAAGLASAHGASEVLQALIEELNARPDLPDFQWQQRPLFRAAKGRLPGHLEIVRYLTARGDVDVNATDDYGQTALAVAAELGVKDAVKILLDAGADPTLRDKEDRTAWSRAKAKGRTNILDLLSERGSGMAFVNALERD